MKKYFFTWMLVSTLAWAQCEISSGTNAPQENTRLYGIAYIFPVGLEGSPYLYDDWQDGKILLENGETAERVPIRFNRITNDLVFYNKELLKVFRADKATIHSFDFLDPDGKNRLFIKYTGEEVLYRLQKNDLIEVLHEGHISLYVKHFSEIIASNDLHARDKIHPSTFYFLKVGDQTVEVRKNIRSVFRYFPGNKKEIKKWLAQNQLTRRSEKSFTRLVEWMNTHPENFLFQP
ncbi:MAG TPA: hypothetical protein PLK12_09630 [Prolixibacteraceae bacterium]|nr:hypothetical protein [Prolixibacteraceae bacterium]